MFNWVGLLMWVQSDMKYSIGLCHMIVILLLLDENKSLSSNFSEFNNSQFSSNLAQRLIFHLKGVLASSYRCYEWLFNKNG